MTTWSVQGSPQAVAGTRWVHLERLARELARQHVDTRVTGHGSELVLQVLDPVSDTAAFHVSCYPTRERWFYLCPNGEHHATDDLAGAAGVVAALASQPGDPPGGEVADARVSRSETRVSH